MGPFIVQTVTKVYCKGNFMNIMLIGKESIYLQSSLAKVVIQPQYSIDKGKQDVIHLLTQMSFPIKEDFSEALVVYQPGEYEIKGVPIQGIQISREKGKQSVEVSTAFVVTLDCIRVCYISPRFYEVNTQQLEDINEVHVLVLPIEEAENALAGKIIKSLEPNMIIPYTTKADTKVLSDFCKTRGVVAPEPVKEVEISLSEVQLQEEKVTILQ